MQNRHRALELLFVLVLGCIVILTYLAGSAGIWEPWEASTLLTARQVAQTNITEPAFWVPSLDGEIVYRPYLQLWLLAACFHIFPDPSDFLLRLSSSIAGLWLLLAMFCVLRRAVSRRSAWISVGILLTLPVFVFGTKLIQGGIWPIFAVSLPILHHLLAVYSSTRREARAMRSLFALSFGLSFLAGGFWALGIVATIFLVAWGLSAKHPQVEAFTRPFRTKYFLFPFYIVFVGIGLCLSLYAFNVGYVLEKRVGVTLTELNEALDEDRVVSLEKRIEFKIADLFDKDTDQTSTKIQRICGEFQSIGRDRHFFCLADSHELLNTDANAIFEMDEIEAKRFNKLVLSKFGELPVVTARVPNVKAALMASLRFFSRYVDDVHEKQNVQLARVNPEALKANPMLAVIKKDVAESSLAEEAFGFLGYDGFLSRVQGGEVVELLPHNPNDASLLRDGKKYVEIKSSHASGYVPEEILEVVVPDKTFEWKNFGRISALGIFPWIALFPFLLIGAFAPVRYLGFVHSPFRGEFVKTEDMDQVNATRSPLQWLLLSWFLCSTAALWVGINFTGFHETTSALAACMLLSIAFASDYVWKRILHDGLLKILLWITACTVIWLCVKPISEAPFYLIQYALIDPLMNWPKNYAFLSNTILSYIPIFAILMIFVFSQIGEQSWGNLYYYIKMRSLTKSSADRSNASLISIPAAENLAPPYQRPTLVLIVTAGIAALFIYTTFLPRISDALTETSLVDYFVNNSGSGEKIYVLNHETERICADYSDCDPGYVCENAQCQISTFSSYALSVAQPVSRAELLDRISPDSGEKAYFVVPQGVLYELNQAYRESFSEGERKNLIVTEAPSSRLYLLTNNEAEKNVNPLNDIILDKLPEDIVRMPLQLSNDLKLEGFKINRFTWDGTGEIGLTMYYRVESAFMTPLALRLKVEWAKHQSVKEHQLDRLAYGSAFWLEGDIIADYITIPLTGMQTHTNFNLSVCVHASGDSCDDYTSMTVIEY